MNESNKAKICYETGTFKSHTSNALLNYKTQWCNIKVLPSCNRRYGSHIGALSCERNINLVKLTSISPGKHAQKR